MIERLKNRAKLEHGKIEDVAFRRETKVMPHDEVISLVVEHFGVDETQLSRQQRGTYYRPMTAIILFRYCGMTQREIANILGLTTGAAVSVAVVGAASGGGFADSGGSGGGRFSMPAAVAPAPVRTGDADRVHFGNAGQNPGVQPGDRVAKDL